MTDLASIEKIGQNPKIKFFTDNPGDDGDHRQDQFVETLKYCTARDFIVSTREGNWGLLLCLCFDKEVS